MAHTSPLSQRMIRAFCFLLIGAAFSSAKAQTDVFPSSVDVRLVQGSAADQLLIQVKTHSSANFGGILSALTVTVHYDPASGSTLGAGTSFCNAWSAFSPAPVVTNGGIAYRNYNGFGVNRLEDPVMDGGCGVTLMPEQWFTISTIPVIGSGCTTFSIANDAFTDQTNRSFYMSMGGHDVTGLVVGGAMSGGACATDCLGVPGGTALPGTPCNDNDPNTSNDTWSAACVCIGTGCIAPVISGTSTNSPICSGNALSLSVTATGTGPLTYAWTGTGTFSPDASSPNVSVAGAAAGSYQVTVTNSCGNTLSTIPVTVQQSPDATISYPGSPFCGAGGNANVTRTGTSGGTYSSSPGGLSINTGTGAINLAASSAGNYMVTYLIAAGGSCPAFSTTSTVEITTGPSSAIAYGGSPYCTSAGTASVTRTGSGGGTYTASPGGLSINGNSGAVNLGNSTVGTYTVTYTIAASGDCAAFSTTTSLTITAAPSATISYNGSPYCGTPGTASVSRNGTGGGTYTASPSGLSINSGNGTIDLANSTTGTYMVTYTIAAGGGCAAFITTAQVVISAASTWYADTDNDGFGDNASTVQACSQPAGYVAVGGDMCPTDPSKVAPGACGCGIPDTDTDNDGTADCIDGCPADPNKTAPGVCGCGIPDTDTDQDGVADCIDSCPTLAGEIDGPCDDGDSTTVNDIITPQCVCEGTITIGIVESERAHDVIVSLYPNPHVSGMVHVDIDGLSAGNKDVVIEVHDVSGRLVYQGSALQAGGKAHIAMDLSNAVGRGLYMVEVIAGGQLFLKRLVMQ